MSLLNPEDEHVVFYGREVHRHNRQTTTTEGGHVFFKTWSGNFSYADDQNRAQLPPVIGAAVMPYPRLPVSKLNEALRLHHPDTTTTTTTTTAWELESIAISHVHLLGSLADFETLASCLKKCETLKTVLLSDAITSPLGTTNATATATGTSLSGFDTLIRALSLAPQLQEVSLQNMTVSPATLGHLCRSTSLVKLQILVSQSMGSLSGPMIQPLSLQLQQPVSVLRELRIFGLLDYDACDALSNMLVQNTCLQKLALKVKLVVPPGTNQDSTSPELLETATTTTQQSTSYSNHLPLLTALGSKRCSLTSLELYLSGSRTALENYVTHFGIVMRANPTMQHLNLILYQKRPPPSVVSSNSIGSDRSNSSSLWLMNQTLPSYNDNTLMATVMHRLVELLQHNYRLEQLTINHGLVELDKAIPMYLRLNRAGRRQLLLVEQGHNNNGRAMTTTTTVEDEQRAELELWIETLGRVRQDISCVFYLIKCHPTLFCGGRQDHDGREGEDDGVCQHQLPLKRKLPLSPTRSSS